MWEPAQEGPANHCRDPMDAPSRARRSGLKLFNTVNVHEKYRGCCILRLSFSALFDDSRAGGARVIDVTSDAKIASAVGSWNMD